MKVRVNVPDEAPRLSHIDLGLATLAIHQVASATVVEVHGEIDISNTTVLRVTIGEALHPDVSTLVVDLRHTSYIDSSGTGLMLELAKEMATKRGALAIVAPRGSRARRVFELSGVDHALRIHETADAALACTG